MVFQGEHLFPGIVGRASIVLALFFSLASAFAYLIYHYKKEKSVHLLRASRFLYGSHFILVLSACVLLFYILFNHYFEYNYVWKHSSVDTPVAYIISCFWAGQEGSFLIWILIQGFLGFFVVKRLSTFEPIALAVISFIQFLLIANILGINFLGFQIGASPFFLLRELNTDALFNDPNYLSFITDGNGLNPLLQNPWMVIHPPLIFSGYALAVIPYALIIAALIKKQYEEVIKPLIFWTVTSLLFLGAGIIIGGAWAYEALTFGGFWSWDPVENASLVPWIVLLAALHFILVFRRKNFLLMPAFIFSVLGYLLVVYATFLTRSGVLSNTSAHSFGDNGLQYPIVILFFALLVWPAVLLFMRRKDLNRKDNSTFLSVEFMMYVGSILLLLSAFQVIFTTSLPVINKIFSLQLTSPNDRVTFYNSWQLPFAVAICLVMAVAQILNNKKLLIRNLFLPFVLVTIISLLLKFYLQISDIRYILLNFFSLLCVFFSLDFFVRFWKRTTNKAATLTHLGFGTFILGVLLTFSNKQIISTTGSNEHTKNETAMLIKDKLTKAGKYYMLYDGKEKINNIVYFNINFYEKTKDNALKFTFNVKPGIVLNSKMGNVYEPYVRKFLHKDIFAYITYADTENTKPDTEIIVIKVISFPYINLMWIGVLIMLSGFIVSFIKRKRVNTLNL